MHTFIATNKTVFNYNSDLSGNVRIRTGSNFYVVNGKDILEFVAEYVRLEKISKLEQMTTNQILEIANDQQ